MIGILGGTFDPVHQGHIAIALELTRQLNLDELRLIPSYIPPHRLAPKASARDRLEMLKLAIKDHPKLKLDEQELKRETVSYAVDTLRSLRAEIGPTQSLVFILGVDAFNAFNHWKDWQSVLTLCHLVVVNRPGVELTPEEALQELIQKHKTQELALLESTPCGFIYFQAVEPQDISATLVRNQESTGIIAVDHFIKQHRLYHESY